MSFGIPPRADPNEPEPPWEPWHAEPGDIVPEGSGWSVGSAHAQTFRWDADDEAVEDGAEWPPAPSDRVALVAVLSLAAVALAAVLRPRER